MHKKRARILIAVWLLILALATVGTVSAQEDHHLAQPKYYEWRDPVKTDEAQQGQRCTPQPLAAYTVASIHMYRDGLTYLFLTGYFAAYTGEEVARCGLPGIIDPLDGPHPQPDRIYLSFEVKAWPSSFGTVVVYMGSDDKYHYFRDVYSFDVEQFAIYKSLLDIPMECRRGKGEVAIK